MLSPEEIKRIETEEEIRYLTQKKLDSSKNPKELWDYLNSSFVLWFLSSVVIALLSFVYSCSDNMIEQGQIRDKRIEKLDMEIEGRIFQLEELAKRIEDSLKIEEINGMDKEWRSPESKAISNVKHLNDSVKIIPTGADFFVNRLWYDFKTAPYKSEMGFYTVYEEFDETTIVALVAELTTLIEDKKELEPLKTVLHRITSNDLVSVKDAKSKQRAKLANYVSSIRLERWKKNWPIIQDKQ